VVLGLLLSVLAIVSKIIGCGLPMYREGWRSMLQVGVGMTPRGEVALIVALIGLQMNMISQRAYALVILMTGITTILPPPFLKVLFGPVSAPVTQAAVADEESAEAQVSGQLG
jgi:Kef-type K+ transport system membrane component KefB